MAEQQAASEPCAIFDALTSPDQDCDSFVSSWGITVEDFVFWVRHPRACVSLHSVSYFYSLHSVSYFY
jgi:hypothetical protein